MSESLATPFDDAIVEEKPPIRRVKIQAKKKDKGEKPQYPSISKNERFPPLPGLPKSPKVKAEFIFTYWKGLSEENRARCTMYVYRKWPVIDRTKVGGPDAEKNIGKYHQPMDIEEIERIHGSGDYHIILNEQYLYKRTVLYSAHPLQVRQDDSPPILNINELDMSDPANASYIERLRLKGVKFPGEEDKDMAATNQAVDKMADTVINLTDKIMAQRPQVTATPVQPQQAPTDPMRMIEGIVAVAERISPKESSDPMKAVEAIVAVAERISPKADGSQAEMFRLMMESQRQSSERILEMQDRRIETQDRRMENLERELAASRQTTTAAAPKSIIEILREAKEQKELFSDLAGNGPDEDPRGRRNPWWMEVLPVAIPAFTNLAGLAANMLHNMAVAKAGAGNPQAPPPPPTAPLTPQQQEVMQAMPGIAPPQQQENTMDPLYAILSQHHPFLREVERPLVEFFFDPERPNPGADFAELIITLKGRPIYERLKSAGDDMLTKLLESYAPVWGQIGTRPDKVATFIGDFCNYDEIVKQVDVEPEPEPVRRVKVNG